MKKSRDDLVREANNLLRNAGHGKLAIRQRKAPSAALAAGKGAPVDAPFVCPICGSPMVARTRRGDGHSFFGCSTFPKCRGTRDGRDYDDNPDPIDNDLRWDGQ